eukprot:CAMPEP_0201941864 /NCGR_PEP_ID=MMETSP0903-20130614/47873_1 /ASSEMBLY_ACC=CAM_ASM_000552 /TAXON_ID=420261 /ORGANISM="Thalassiosira antarctica, Strain CCMP982" /LENGTH=74 /DNA_ID=CAMNT_0048484049 /DNA_START=83 /DNA_END=307 /DNA_ORIENTATION=-
MEHPNEFRMKFALWKKILAGKTPDCDAENECQRMNFLYDSEQISNQFIHRAVDLWIADRDDWQKDNLQQKKKNP